ncbi:MAG: hypothetical protein L0Z62_11260 [Gemmataceae bacterium]|nr:hypothetical protein [Gemmataceae bacterium]
MTQLFRGIAQVSQKEQGDAQLQVPTLGGGTAGALHFLAQIIGHLAQGAVLVPTLRQGIAQLLNRARITIFPLYQKCFDIDHA